MSYVQIPDAPKGPPEEKSGAKLAHSSDEREPKQSWAELGLEARAMILLTFGILLVAGLTAYVFIRQADVMEGRLEEMRGTGAQTERLIDP